MDFDPLEFFKEEIRNDSAMVRIGAAGRLHLIVSALGPQKTVSDFMPFLFQAIQAEPFCNDDEFLFTVAEQCELISDRMYISGQDEILLAPLEYLAAQEETIIRQQAITSLCHIVSRRASLVPEYLVPMLHRLASANEFFTARVSACGLLPTVYRLAFSEQQAGLREVFSSLCTDDAPMVRRAAASRMGDLISVCSKEVILDHMIRIFRQLSQEDSQDTIRVSCIDAALAICRRLDKDENMQHTVPFIRDSVEDRSWVVRLAVAKNFAQFCSVLGTQVVSEHLVVPFTKLMKDSEPDVRKEAMRVIEPCQFSCEQLLQHLLPLFETLSFDPAQPVRVMLAQSLGPVAVAIGKKNTEELLLGYISDLLKDQFHDVRLGMASHVGLLCEVMGVDGMVHDLIKTTQELFLDSHWRIRQKVIEQMPRLARLFGAETFKANFESLYLSSLRDSVHSVRETTTTCLKEVADAFGPQWTIERFLPMLLEMYSQSTSYAYRVTTLQGLPMVSHKMSPEEVVKFIVPVLVKATKDGVPNVRFCACQNIMWMVQNHELGSVALNNVIKPALLELQQDSDSDVQYFTQRAIAVC